MAQKECFCAVVNLGNKYTNRFFFYRQNLRQLKFASWSQGSRAVSEKSAS